MRQGNGPGILEVPVNSSRRRRDPRLTARVERLESAEIRIVENTSSCGRGFTRKRSDRDKREAFCQLSRCPRRGAGNSRDADVVALGQFLQGRTLRATVPRFGLLLRSKGWRTAHVLPARFGSVSALRRAGTDQVALHVRQAAQNGNHQPPGAGFSVSPQFG